MPGKTLVGVFDSVSAAERATATLVESGVSTDRIAVSASLTEDGIAAEAPGQSYEHQSYRGSDKLAGFDWLRTIFGRNAATDTDRARYNEAVRSGACILTVDSHSAGDGSRIKDLMHREGARITMERPVP